MRFKGFVIFIGIFSILYTIFCHFYDKFYDKKDNENQILKAQSIINIDVFKKFAAFYGINASVNKEIILDIFKNYKNITNYSISSESSKYKISSLEFVIVLLYLEYFGLMNVVKISFQDDRVTKTNSLEEVKLQRYYDFFAKKADYKTITNSVGLNSDNELVNINKYFLAPGIRIVDSKIFYVGDYL